MTENETYCYDPTTGERVKATYQVRLTMPAAYDGYVEVEAYSEEEAARLALSDWTKVDWRFDDEGDRHSIEVLDIECDNPPEGALLSRPGSSEADISAHFEDAPGLADTDVAENHDGSATESGERCK